MKAPSPRALGAALLVAAACGGVWWMGQRPLPADVARGLTGAPQPIEAIPEGAMLLVTADLARLRAFGLAPEAFGVGREIPGLGDVRSACGFDPLASFSALALAIPEGGADGDFGLVARGDQVPAESLLACTSKVIEARGGRPVVSSVGTFRTVRDVSLATPGGEIAARPGGLVLLGAGEYLRAMIDAADGQITTVRGHPGHQRLRAALGGDAVATATLVLGPKQRAAMAEEVARAGADVAPPAVAKVAAAGLALGLEAERIALHAVIACDDGRAAIEVAAALERLRREHAGDPWLRLAGIAPLLETVLVEVERERVHVRTKVTRAEIERLVGLLAERPGAGPPDGRRPAPEPAPSVGVAPSASAPASAVPSADAAPPAEAPPSAAPPSLKKPPRGGDLVF